MLGDDALLFAAAVLGPLFAWAAYAKAIGSQRFFQAVVDLPRSVAAMFKDGGRDAVIHALTGAIIALVIRTIEASIFDLHSTWWINIATNRAAGFALAAIAFSRLGPALSGAIGRRQGSTAPPHWLAAGWLGAAIPFVVSGPIALPPWVELALCAGALVVLKLMPRRKSAAPPSSWLFWTGIALAPFLYELFDAVAALAQERPRSDWACGSLGGGGLLCGGGETRPDRQISLLNPHLEGALGGGGAARLGTKLGGAAGQPPRWRRNRPSRRPSLPPGRETSGAPQRPPAASRRRATTCRKRRKAAR